MEKSKSEGLHLLTIFNMMHKKDELVNSLSGGMKRKLSLAIALIGSPEVSSYNIIIIMLSLKVYFVLRYKIGYLCLDINLR